MVPRGINVDAWIGWLLRVHRITAQPGSDSSDFSRQLDAVGYRGNPSLIDQCERGSVRIPETLVGAYERVLDLPAGTLTSVCEAAREALADDAIPAPARSRDETIRSLREIDARITSQAATGADWLMLADLAAEPNPVMLPPTLAREWTGQLLAETVRAVRSSRTTRLRALGRLVQNPQTRDAVSDTIFEFAATAAVTDPVAALGVIGFADDPRLMDRLITLLDESAEPLRRAAAFALLVPIGRGRLSRAQLQRIGDATLRICRDDPQHAAPAVTLASRLSRRRGHHLIQLMGHDPRPPAGRALPCAGLSGLLAATSVDLDNPSHDGVLTQLLQVVLIGRYPERRHHALRLLAASPHRSALADAAVDLTTSSDPVTVGTAAMALPYLAGAAQQSSLLDLLTRPCPDVRSQALQALARGAEVPRGYSLAPHFRDHATEISAVFAAGMSAHPQLARVSSSDAVSSEARRSADWWMRHGPRIEDPPRRPQSAPGMDGDA